MLGITITYIICKYNKKGMNFDMKQYIHKVQYYETDKMGVVHHSNYIRYMEEARVDFLEQIGWGFDKLEQAGIVSPVVGVQVRYKQPCRFPETIAITVHIEKYNGILLHIGYEMKHTETGVLVCTAHSEHCFLDMAGKPIRLKHDFPLLDNVLKQYAAK